MPARYAENTDVPSDRSEAAIKKVLSEHGADTIATVTSRGRAAVMFEMNARRVQFELRLPDPDAREFTHHARGTRTADAAAKVYEQAIRQRWRALHLVIRARLEAVEAGIETFEEAFLAHVVLPSGETVGAAAASAIAAAYAGEPMPALLPGSNR